MVELTESEIKARIADGRISAITLDTSIFDGNGNRFELGLLAKLDQFKNTPVEFILSDVVLAEVRSHVIRDAKDAKTKTVKALKELGRSWQITNAQRDAALAVLFGVEEGEELAERRINSFREATEFKKIASNDRVDVRRLLDDYFSSRAPFGLSSSKKSEFPDAIALQALESWADEKNVLILVVSKDGDWKKYCKDSARLVIVDDLALALSYFHQNAEVACTRLALRLLEGSLNVDADLQRAVQFAVDRINFIPEVSSGYYFDAEIDEVTITEIELQEDAYSAGPFRVIDKPENELLVVEAVVTVTVEVSAYMTFSIYDSIDKDEVPIGGARPCTETSLTFNVLLTFKGDLAADAALVDAEIETTKSNFYVDFGDVGPEWEPDQEY